MAKYFSSIQVITLFVCLCALLGCAEKPAPRHPISGAWQPVAYQLHQGEREAVDGLIFFEDGVWSVVFFVKGEGGEPIRGSGEGGTYRVDREQLDLTHRFMLSAGEPVGSMHQEPLKMELRPDGGSQVERCTYQIEGDRLTIFFPSKNQMVFERIPSGRGASD